MQDHCRSPASTTDPNCGYPIYAGSGGVCFNGPGTKSTFMIQFCCGTGDCTAAGASKRDDNSAVASSVVLRDINDNILVPQSVGDSAGEKMDIFMEDLGLNSSTVLLARSTTGAPIFKVGHEEYEDNHHAITKRDCDTFIADGAPYTKTGDVSTQIGGYICGDAVTVGITNEVSVSQTTTFSASVGDPFGVVSASVGFEVEESASQSTTYEFTPLPGQCGHVAFTPFYTCTSGTITGCEGGDQNGEVCTAKRVSDDRIDGAYSFAQTE
ncbi:hypothetical protein CB0940_05179 [Cercospora beticola]|uniref:Uncharacterized protein n=1 Tax=Cercospora beticola TaxID=122368 RepID=A0A2G5HJ29_CERBT|nr:hypothetical protein CB0940_05179 [Cercospora beticola]PIA92539.1 hypothetical protein CB0940_05179 [Cercospora beticola]WPB02490.1 hypothetical protein RHO25_007126 [Cercospora beticola]